MLKSFPKLSSFQLKIIAVIFMFAEHFGEYLPGLLPVNLPLIFKYAGRIVAPLFFYLAVESYFKTSNKKKYILRLYMLAAIMQIGNLLMAQTVKLIVSPERLFGVGHNIFLTIALGVSIVAVMEWTKTLKNKKKLLGYFIAGIISIVMLLSESAYVGLLLFWVFYLFYNKKPQIWYAYAGVSALMLLNGLMNIQNFWTFEYQWFMIAALPLLMLYSGERGRGLRYFFYIFYPLHIWILYLISNYFGLR